MRDYFHKVIGEFRPVIFTEAYTNKHLGRLVFNENLEPVGFHGDKFWRLVPSSTKELKDEWYNVVEIRIRAGELVEVYFETHKSRLSLTSKAVVPSG